MRTTLAPQSASWRTQTGPARAWVMSRTVRPSSARDAGLCTIFLSALLGDDRLRPGSEILRSRQNLFDGVLKLHTRDGTDLDPGGRRRLKKFGILDRGVESVTQRLDAIRRYVGRRRHWLAKRITGDDQLDHLAVVLVLREFLHRWNIQILC